MTILTTTQTWTRTPNPSGHKSRRELARLTHSQPKSSGSGEACGCSTSASATGATCRARWATYHRVTVERVLNIRKTASLAFAMRVGKKRGVGDAGGPARRGFAEAGGVPDVRACWRVAAQKLGQAGAGGGRFRPSMRAIFEALTWGDWVDEGDSAPRYCTLGGVAKTVDAGMPYLAVNEYVCAELGRVVGLPAVPGVVVKDKALTGFVSLRFGPKGEKPPPGIPGLLVREQPELTAGIVAFDCWISNTDRHSHNFAYSVTSKRAHLFDHDRALFSTVGAKRLLDKRDEHGLESHEIAQAMVSSQHLLSWATSIGSIPERSLRLAIDEMETGDLLTKEDGSALLRFLLHRRDHLRDLLRSAQAAGCFPLVMQGSLL